MDSSKQLKKEEDLEDKIEVDIGEFRDMLLFDMDMAEGLDDKEKFQKAANSLSIFDHYFRTHHIKCFYLPKEEKYVYEINPKIKMGF